MWTTCPRRDIFWKECYLGVGQLILLEHVFEKKILLLWEHLVLVGTLVKSTTVGDS